MLLQNAVPWLYQKILRVKAEGVFNSIEHPFCFSFSEMTERFSRVAEERNYAFQGIGLGLYIATEIIKGW